MYSPHRRSRVSIFSCEQVFRARQPLPQFLASSKQALKALETHVEEQICQARETNGNLKGLSLVYAFAESEVMEEVVDTRAEPAIIWHVIVVDDSTAMARDCARRGGKR
jgi:hypothetical protein